MLAALIKPTAIALLAIKMPLAISPALMRSGKWRKVTLTTTKVKSCTTKAIAPQIAQSAKDCAWVMALERGKAKPTQAPAKAIAAAVLLARINANSSCGVNQL